MNYYSGYINELKENEVFVFGSNPGGRHGAGTAKIAKEKFGAEYGIGRVVGEDRKVHLSDLTTNKTKCGVNIIKNYVSDKDSLYSCYECTY